MKLKIFILLFISSISFFAQEKASLSGYIKDAKNGESLIGATVSKMGSNIGTYANEYGFFSIALPKGQHVIEVSLIGYQTFTFSIDLQKIEYRKIYRRQFTFQVNKSAYTRHI